jgi:hypothetical protein
VDVAALIADATLQRTESPPASGDNRPLPCVRSDRRDRRRRIVQQHLFPM